MADLPESNSHKVDIRIRYAETDAMGFVYYGNYFTYFEVARISALENLGFPYHEMEKNNILIPVLSARADYKKPAKFGDVISICSKRHRVGKTRIQFTYEVYCREKLIATGETQHTFMDSNGRPIRPPEEIIRLFEPL